MLKNINICFYLIVAFILCKSELVMPADSNKNAYVVPSTFILDFNDNPTQALSELLATLNVHHDNSLASIVKETQAQWLRQAGKERWQVSEVYAEFKAAIKESAHKLGLIDEIKPVKRTYKYAIILGATVKRVRTRLAYLISLWKQGIRFEHIICLGSERLLDASIESEAQMLDANNGEIEFNADWKRKEPLPTTEYEMMQFVYEQSEIPQEFRAIPIIFFNSLMRKNDNGTLRRPTTGDTIIDWLATQPAAGDCLFISNQPYVCYQDCVVRTFMDAHFGQIESAGSQASDFVNNSEILDTLARLLYQEKMRREKK